MISLRNHIPRYLLTLQLPPSSREEIIHPALATVIRLSYAVATSCDQRDRGYYYSNTAISLRIYSLRIVHHNPVYDTFKTVPVFQISLHCISPNVDYSLHRSHLERPGKYSDRIVASPCVQLNILQRTLPALPLRTACLTLCALALRGSSNAIPTPVIKILECAAMIPF